MVEAKLQVEGLRELRRGLRALGDDLPKELRDVGKQVTGRIVDRSKPDIPVRTGALANTARHTTDAAVLGTARLRYTEFVYWQRQNRWYHREADKLDSSGTLRQMYEDGIRDLARRNGLEAR